MDQVGGNLSNKPDDPGGVRAGGSDLSGVGGRPGWSGLLAAGAVVLVVGGFALSQDYGVPNVTSDTLPSVPLIPSTQIRLRPTSNVLL